MYVLVGEREKERSGEIGRERAYTAQYTCGTMKMLIITRSLIELEVNILILAYAVTCMSVDGHKI